VLLSSYIQGGNELCDSPDSLLPQAISSIMRSPVILLLKAALGVSAASAERLADAPCVTRAEFPRAVVDGLDGASDVPHQATGMVAMEMPERVTQFVIDDPAHSLNEELLDPLSHLKRPS